MKTKRARRRLRAASADEDKLNDDDDDDDGDEDDEEDGDEDDEEDEKIRSRRLARRRNRNRRIAIGQGNTKPNTKRLKALLTATQRALLSATSAPRHRAPLERSRVHGPGKQREAELVRDIDHPAVTTGLSLSIGRWPSFGRK